MRAFLSSVAASVVLCGCGAKTGLRVPCEYPTTRVRPTVAILEARSTTVWLNQAHRGLPMAEAALFMWERLLPQLDEVAVMGGTWQPALGEPLAPTSENPPICTAWPNLLVPFEPNNSARVLGLFRDLRPRFAPDANVAALNYVVDELIRVAPPDSPRWVLMQDSGIASCETIAQQSPDPAVAAPHFAAARRRGVNIMLIAVFPHNADSSDFRWEANVGTWADALEQWSVQGGATRVNGPAHYWVWTETEAIAAAANENIVRPYYCQPHVVVPAGERADLVLVDDQGQTIPRDTGWRWSETAPDHIEVLGAFCARVAEHRSALRLVSSEFRCYE